MATPTSSTGDDLIIISDDTSDVGTATLPSNTVENTIPEITVSDSSVPSESVSSMNASNDIFGGLDLSSLSGTTTIGNTEDTTSSVVEAPVSTDLEVTLTSDIPKTETPLEVTLSSDIPVTEESVEVETTQLETALPEPEVIEEIEEETIEAAEISGVAVSSGDDMDSILSDTIAKLQKRQEVNRSTKGSKTSQIDGLNQKISTLKEQVETLKDDVGALDAEFAKIDANVIGLENMKSVPSEIAEIDMKSHNQKRVIRTKKAA